MAFKGLNKLKLLGLSDNKIDDEEINFLENVLFSNAESIKMVDLANNRIERVNYTLLDDFPNTNKFQLKLYGNPVDKDRPAIVEPMDELPKLRLEFVMGGIIKKPSTDNKISSVTEK
jgi:hypothetical protein